MSAAGDHPFVEAVARYAEEELRPAALATDAAEVPRAAIDRLRALGALNHLAPAAYGGAGLDLDADRRLHEVLSGACFNTWLVWAQHAPFVGRLAAKLAADRAPSPLAERVLRGEILCGAGISDVRRFPDRYIAATRAPGGWTFDGTITWVSGWGLNEVVAVAAVETSTAEPGTARVVTALVPVSDRTVATPLRLATVTGSRTERVRLDAVPVADEDVLAVQSFDEWRRADAALSGDARPHLFGLAAAVLRELEAEPHAAAREVAAAWSPLIAQFRATAYNLTDEAADAEGPHRIEERLALKITVLEALGTLTRALTASRSGHGIAADDTAQLHARSAQFCLVQGQSAAARDAHLARLAADVPNRPTIQESLSLQ
ncbi:acyl-CoA dehydrogenase family protein [Glycomyces dulcitolivorans]|uniref:acyl-CoA dehydrogenase family protein n=1 Tax=Glycomyces dulcitolivorans TaxID=2200759 RepID=UPI000DD3B0DC|nr:acyl-CoA dehydrogenase family protein [Glycomyces dulcitolivorans]